MKSYFSIEFKHSIDGRRVPHLTLRLASTQNGLVSDHRILFRQSPGYIECFIEDDEAIARELDQLIFWVICTQDEFYQFTEFTAVMNSNDPTLLWKNIGASEELLANNDMDEFDEGDKLQMMLLHDHQDINLLHKAGPPPQNALGCIVLDVQKIHRGKAYSFMFKAKKTIWRYHIHTSKPLDSWKYRIEDAKNEWHFELMEQETEDRISFQSSELIAYQNRASDRLKLKWDPSENLRFEEGGSLTLPFANYAYKTLDGDKTETTPIYIHI